MYCQFDQDEFFAGDHVYTKGYFDYENDGFGEVTYNINDLVDIIIQYMTNGCILNEIYRKRIIEFFAFNDNNNCKRILNKLIELRTD